MLTLIALFSLPTTAAAQEGPENTATVFRPSLDSDRTLLTDDAGSIDTAGPSLRASLGYAGALDADGGVDEFEIYRLDLGAGQQIGRVRLGLSVPIYPEVTSVDGSTQTSGIGDIAADGRVTMVESGAWGLAATARAWAPTSTLDPLDGDAGGFEVGVAGDVESGRAMAAVNLGVREQEFDPANGELPGDAVFLRAGAAYEVARTLDVIADMETHARFDWSDVDDGRVAVATGLVGLSTAAIDHVDLRAGVGATATDGAGDPLQPRAMVMVGYRNQQPNDADLDGIARAVDACDDAAEDFDGFEDADGCPDIDNDQDGLVDAADACPLEAEDLDSFADLDGCPDPSYLVAVDLHSAAGSHVVDGELVYLGPDAGVISGHAAALDLHPGTYEVVAGADDHESAYRLVTVDGPGHWTFALDEAEDQEIVALRTVYFHTDSARLTPDAQEALDRLVARLSDADTVALVVAGHADERGPEGYNYELGQDRAQSVLSYLADADVTAERVTLRSFGERRPANPGDGAEAWEDNRRVVVKLVAQP